MPEPLAAPLVGTGVLMVTYLLLRPYGDAGGTEALEAAIAFADWRWAVAHLAGALPLASIARLAVRMHDRTPSPLTRVARGMSLVGVVFTMLYYGAETFALHAIGTAGIDDVPNVLHLVDDIRDGAVAMTLLGVGLLLLAVATVLLALAWQRERATGAAWSLALLVVAFLPQFFLPPAGRMLYGVTYALAAAVWLASAVRAGRPDTVTRRSSPCPTPGVAGYPDPGVWRE